MVELWLVRHGETEWNRLGKIQGCKDIPLNENGRAQARCLAAALAGITFDRIVSSDLARARETAEILASCRCLTVELFPQLRERCVGQAEGLPRNEVKARFSHAIPDAETDEAMCERLQQFLNYAASRWDGQRVLCVTHGGALRRILKLTAGVEVHWIDNTSVTRITGDGTTWRTITVNEMPHMDNAPLCSPGCSVSSS